MALDESDKQWMLATFSTKKDLGDLRQEIAEQLTRFATKADLEQVETSLLTEFHKWASPNDQKMRASAQRDN